MAPRALPSCSRLDLAITAQLFPPPPSLPRTTNHFAFPDLRIRTKDKRIVPFVPNAVQQSYLDQICPLWRDGDIRISGERELILKSRQFGFSTLILALLFLDTINTPNTQTVVIAHDLASTARLFQIVQRFYRFLPEATRPATQYANRHEFLWPALDSSFFVGTAGNSEFGRGGTISNILGSEIAFWPNAEELMAGLMQAVPPEGNVFQESTANGVGNYFFDEYERARAKESAMRARFFPWFAHADYSSPAVPPDFAPDEEESGLQSLYGLSDAQLFWRRTKRREPGMRRNFVQEFPANPREAFISSGNPYFDLEKLDALAHELKSPVFDPLLVQVPLDYPNLRREQAGLLLWELPVRGRVYVIGADTAEGITTHGDHDYDSASVWDALSGIQVAHLHGRWDTHLYGLLLAELGRWYNTALLCIERNNHGHAVINSVLYAANYPEARTENSTGLYLHQEYDERRQPRERKAGFPTTSVSKTLILDELASAVESGDFHPRSRALVSDMMRFVKLPGGKAGGEGKTHDDRVLDAALARRMLNLRPRAQTPFFFNVK